MVETVFSRARAQVEPLDRFSRFLAQTTCFCAMKCLLGGYNDRWHHLRKICPQNPLKVGVNRQFKAKIQKIYKSRCLYTKLWIRSAEIWGQSRDHHLHFVERLPLYLKPNPTWPTAAILKIAVTSQLCWWRSDSDEIWYADGEPCIYRRQWIGQNRNRK